MDDLSGEAGLRLLSPCLHRGYTSHLQNLMMINGDQLDSWKPIEQPPGLSSILKSLNAEVKLIRYVLSKHREQERKLYFVFFKLLGYSFQDIA